MSENFKANCYGLSNRYHKLYLPTVGRRKPKKAGNTDVDQECSVSLQGPKHSKHVLSTSTFLHPILLDDKITSSFSSTSVVKNFVWVW